MVLPRFASINVPAASFAVYTYSDTLFVRDRYGLLPLIPLCSTPGLSTAPDIFWSEQKFASLLADVEHEAPRTTLV